MLQFLSLSRYVLISVFIILLSTSEIHAQILINEVCSSNSNIIADPDRAKNGDWIELYNAGEEWVNLESYYLTDDTSRLDKWKFPAETFVGPDGYILIFADGLGSKLHTNFNLDKAGEWLAYCDSSGLIVDSISMPYLLNDMSYGRLPGDMDKFSVFVNPTPGTGNVGTSSARIASFVEFSLAGGFYTGTQKVVLSYPFPGNTIYYTTDGSYPTKNSAVYTDTLDINQTSAIRSICYEEGTITGIAVTQTYFIDEPQNLPIFSLVTDSVHLFSDETGIMVEGTAGVRGYCTEVPHNLNQDWERPVNLEFFEDDGTRVLNQMCGTKIFGGCSRIRYPQKSLAFFARSSYETSSFAYQLFPDKHAEEYESFILRASGDDQPKTLFRDALTQTLVKDLIDVDVQAYRPAVLYINGDYWGIINMREKLNEHYPANNYDIDSDNVSLLRRNPESSWNTIAGSADHYNAMMEYIRNNDITRSFHYDYVSTQMDIDEYINYQIIQIFFGGRDWPGNNIKFWRSTEAPYDKWRWILYDLDAHSNDAVGNIMEEATEPDCGCSWPNPSWSTFLFRSLLENDEFSGKFIERFNTYTNTVFARDRYYATISEMQNRIAPEIPRHIERWGGQRIDNPDNTWMSPVFNSFEEWNGRIQVMRDFVGLRHEIAVQQVNEYFGIEGTKRLKLFNTDSSGATLMIGDIPLYDSAFGGNYSTGTDIEISVIPDPGFIFTHWDKVSYTPSDSFLITEGDEWKYKDDGLAIDSDWKELDFDDVSWGTGNAEFGYGDDDETTIISYGPDPGNKYITTFFRKIFRVEDNSDVETYELKIKRDDASVVFLNGYQVVKENMPQYGHNQYTQAVVAISGEDEDIYLTYNLNPKLFVSGDNIIAVEIHQANPGSSDISFDMQLIATSMQEGDISVVHTESLALEMNDNYGLTAHVIPETKRIENVYINEVITNNSTGLTDEAGDYEDWIEFYNGGSEAVDLAGLFLADTLPVKKTWSFPAENAELTMIEPEGHLVVIADNEPEEGPLHANFRLSNEGEEITLMQKIGHDTVIVDQFNFGQQYRDVSIGRYPDGSASQFLMNVFTPLSANVWEPLSPVILGHVVINEIMASNVDKYADEASDFEDWIEIYNGGDEAVNLAGYYLADSIPVTRAWKFPSDSETSTTIEPDSFIVVFADSEPLEGPLHASFRLSGAGEEVVLLHILGEDTTIIDHVVFGDQYNNVSWGRYPDGADEFQFMPYITPWHSNYWEPLDTTSVISDMDTQYAIYPNPAKSLFYIDMSRLDIDERARVRIYSFTGREVLMMDHLNNEIIEVSMDEQPSGLYLVELIINGRRFIQKVILE